MFRKKEQRVKETRFFEIGGKIELKLVQEITLPGTAENRQKVKWIYNVRICSFESKCLR